MNKTNLAIVSLWCNKTLVDTENLLWLLADKINIVSEKESEIVLLNTCSFLKSARDEVHENIELLKDKKIILVWCYSKFTDENIFEKYPQIWAVVPFKKYKEIDEVLDSINAWKKVYFDFEIEEEFLEINKSLKLTLPNVAYLKISEWCNNTCTYCTIPKIRWIFRSRLPENILDEARALLSNWVKEIILTSQDTGYYWRDLRKKDIKINFSEILNQVSQLEWDFKIRFLYMYPERITDELLDLMQKNEKIIPYFDVPFQHASKDVLLPMKRPFVTEKMYELVEKIRAKLPKSIFRTTFIVWFPWEKEKDFEILKKFITDLRLERVWVFCYSNEKWAESYNFPNQIDEKIKKERQKEIYKLAMQISFEENQKLNWEIFEVIIEWFSENLWFFFWRSFREAPDVDWLIYIKTEKEHKMWDTVNVKISDSDAVDLFGEEV